MSTLVGGIDNASSGGGGATPIGVADPTTLQWFYDDFVAGTTVTTNTTNFPTGGLGLCWVTSNSAVATSTASILTPTDTGTSGVLKLTTGATTGNAMNLLGGSSTASTTLTPLGATTFDLKVKAKISTTSNITFQAGFTDNVANTILIRFIAGTDTTWTGQSDNGGSITLTTITGSTLDTNYHTFRIRSTTPGTILYSVDGIEFSNSTNVPTTAQMSPILSVKTNSNASVFANFDYFWGWIAISR